MDKQLLFNYTVSVNGLFGRNRKEKFTTFPLFAKVDRTSPKTLAECLAKMREVLATQKVKPGAKIRVTEDPIEYDGVFISFMLMSERTMLKGTLAENGDIRDPLTGNLFPRE